jgi:O-antigen ligase
MTDAAARPFDAADRAAPRGAPIDYQKIVGFFVWIFVFCGGIALIEPSPYDFASLIAMPLWFLGGFTIHRSFMLLAFFVVMSAIVGFLALIPYWSNAESSMYMYQSAYLTLTTLFYALFTGNRTQARAELCLNAYTASAVLASTVGILGYFDIAHLGETFSHFGRASGTFKDPNVFGSYIILGALYLSQNLLLRRARSVALSLALLSVIVAGVFLSFSRGSWGAFIFAALMMFGSAFLTARDVRMKSRIVVVAVVATIVAAIAVLALLSSSEIRDLFFLRAAATQDYDEGPTGRFGNQMRSIPMLIERFWGFGPLRFRLIFDLEPHNSYVGAFANGGWIGGVLFILLVGVTTFIGLRLMFRASPYQRLAQVVFPALLAFFVQAFQIDIDHWRHVFLMLGMAWGLEAARQKWEMRATTALQEPTPPDAQTALTRP